MRLMDINAKARRKLQMYEDAVGLLPANCWDCNKEIMVKNIGKYYYQQNCVECAEKRTANWLKKQAEEKEENK